MENKNTMEKHEITSHLESIAKTPDSIAYLGVRLPKAQNSEGQFVPSPEKYADYIDDKFSLGLQKDIAVSFLQGDPLLIEGGTSIGKTTTVRKMAADLGWEVHYANLNGATDVEDLMGRYIPNPNKHGPDDPEYIFADGKVTSGLRQEEGKVKVIILDEFNASAPNILIRLHEVLDALNRGEAVVLSEDASEVVPVDKTTTKVVALMNPPGKGYFGREPLDPAQLRRWVYLKAPTDLPDDSFSYSTDALFKLTAQTESIPKEAFLMSPENALLPEQLHEIPGIDVILGKYKEFHKVAKQLVKERHVAADQPQPFTYDDRMEPKRVRDFILAFYNGDINETFQTGLRYYYSNKLDSGVDKAKLEELIRHVEYIAPQNTSQRKGLDRKIEETKHTEAEYDVGRDPSDFINEVFSWIKVKNIISNEKENWSWSFDKKYVDMKYTNLKLDDMFLDGCEKVDFYVGTNGTGVKELLQVLENKRIVSIKTPEGRWFLKIVSETEKSESNLYLAENKAWKIVLGENVEVPPLPLSVTPEVKKNLEKMGMELRFIPALNIDTLGELKDNGVENFLSNLQRRYPNWRRYESLSDTQREDYSITRNLEQWYWKKIKNREIEFPQLPGTWMAVEMMPKPADGDHYAPSKMSEKLGFKDRFNVTWDKANEAINREKRNILNEAGLPSGDVRMLEAIEWNLLANREGWGKTDTCEWTNTEFRDSDGSYRVVVGDSSGGGTAGAAGYHPDDSDGDLGFRIAVVFDSVVFDSFDTLPFDL